MDTFIVTFAIKMIFNMVIGNDTFQIPFKLKSVINIFDVFIQCI